MSRLIHLVRSAALVVLAATILPLDARQPAAHAASGKDLLVFEAPAPRQEETRDVTAMRLLRSKTQFQVKRMALAEFVKFLSSRHKIAFVLDRGGLQRARIQPDTPVSGEFDGVPLSQALQEILGPLNLQHRIVSGVVLITDRRAAGRIGRRIVRRIERHAAQNQPVFFFNAGPQGFVVQNMQQQRIEQLRPLMQVELIFVKSVCTLTKDQVRPLREDLEKFVKTEAEEFQQEGRAGNFQNARPGACNLIDERLADFVEKNLSARQAARYRDEVKKRDASERIVYARALVVYLDRQLCLSARQRDEIIASLSARWDASWRQIVQRGVMQGQNFLPAIPDSLIEPYLDAAQTEVWENMQKIGNVNWGMVGTPLDAFGVPIPNPEDD